MCCGRLRSHSSGEKRGETSLSSADDHVICVSKVNQTERPLFKATFSFELIYVEFSADTHQTVQWWIVLFEAVAARS